MSNLPGFSGEAGFARKPADPCPDERRFVARPASAALGKLLLRA
jgi:hypothetical protein